MASFLVETFTPQPADLPPLAARARAAADTAAEAGIEVSHVRSFFAPADELCFHVFEASSVEAVARAVELAGFEHERITEVIE